MAKFNSHRRLRYITVTALTRGYPAADVIVTETWIEYTPV